MSVFKLSILLLIFPQLVPNCSCTEKIVNGFVADRENFQFQVGILLKENNQQKRYLCGGSVIDSRLILTAAHCLWNMDRGLVILGALDLNGNETGVEKILVFKKNFLTHPEFKLAYAFMDIGLIVLPKPIKFTKSIQPIQLPANSLLDEAFAGEIGTVAGYGKSCDACGPSSMLRYANNRIIGRNECLNLLGIIPAMNQVCVATDTRMSACRGDSGSALTIRRNNSTVQIGISSFGSAKCEDGKPAVFTRLNRDVVEWIEKEIGKVKKLDRL